MRKFSELEDYLKQIREYSDISAEDYAQHWKTQRIVERTLQIMIETCVDIANHIIADSKFRIPKSYRDTFVVLEEEGILNTDISESLQRMAQFRNVVVHGYDKIDEAIVLAILKQNLQDFSAYRDAICAALKREK